MKNKLNITNKTPPKLLILNTDQLTQSKASAKMFRRVKRAVKTLHISTTPRFVDQNHIKTQVKDWIFKMNDSKTLQDREKSKTSRMKTLDLSSEKLYQIYNQIRSDEKLIQTLSPPARQTTCNNQTPIKLNLQEVEKMRSVFENTRVVLSPKDFQVQLGERPSTTFGFRPLQSRLEKQSNSKKQLIGSSLHNKKRCLTERKQLFTIDSYEKYLHKSPTTPLSTSKAEGGSYSHKSRMKKIWETMGLHEWSNLG